MIYTIVYIGVAILTLWTLMFGAARWEWDFDGNDFITLSALWPIWLAALIVYYFFAWPHLLAKHLKNKKR